MVATTDGSLYAGTSGSGIYKSTNQGGSWTAVNNGLPQFSSVSYAESLSTSGTTVYFASGLIYETTNGGASWAAMLSYVDAYVMAASPQNAAGTGLPPGLYYYDTSLVVDPSNSANVFFISPVYQAGFGGPRDQVYLTWYGRFNLD
jgi:hypothetical protein